MAYIGKVPTAVPLSTNDLADSIVTSAKITDGTIALADLSATGTKDATTFLRGDNTFASAGGNMKPVFSAKMSSNQSWSDATTVKVQFNAEDFDDDGVFDSTTNYRFTPNVAGKYYITVSARVFDTNGRIYHAEGQLRKNDSTIKETVKDLRLSSGFGYVDILEINHIVDMNGSTDYLEYYVYLDGGGTLSVTTGSSFFQGYKIID